MKDKTVDYRLGWNRGRAGDTFISKHQPRRMNIEDYFQGHKDGLAEYKREQLKHLIMVGEGPVVKENFPRM